MLDSNNFWVYIFFDTDFSLSKSNKQQQALKGMTVIAVLCTAAVCSLSFERLRKFEIEGLST
jgi:hypothetical protein